MGDFAIGDFDLTDVAGRSVGPMAIGRDDLRRTILRVMEGNVLCSIATLTPQGTAHANTAFFAYSDGLEVFFLSHPASRHCRNLMSNPSVALTVFSSEQRWADPARGIQLFGTAEEASGSAAEDAERWYEGRFAGYATWKASLSAGDLARQYRFYRVVVSTVTILDEEVLGHARFVQGTVVRVAGAPPGA
ncbi:MAG: pyridoxamine 5'-phosphate oxidase family protein [Acidobacteria bacterium]|nr:MAG: pyridoxamine 5'-phosphate oxidase family protein [Acidobacteriota bacterium]